MDFTGSQSGDLTSKKLGFGPNKMRIPPKTNWQNGSRNCKICDFGLTITLDRTHMTAAWQHLLFKHQWSRSLPGVVSHGKEILVILESTCDLIIEHNCIQYPLLSTCTVTPVAVKMAYHTLPLQWRLQGAPWGVWPPRVSSLHGTWTTRCKRAQAATWKILSSGVLSKLRKANHALVMLLGNITELIPANHFLDTLICGASAGRQGPRSQKRWIFGKWAAFWWSCSVVWNIDEKHTDWTCRTCRVLVFGSVSHPASFQPPPPRALFHTHTQLFRTPTQSLTHTQRHTTQSHTHTQLCHTHTHTHNLSQHNLSQHNLSRTHTHTSLSQ